MASIRRILSSGDEYATTTTTPSPIIAPSLVSIVDSSDGSKSNKHLTFVLLSVASVGAACFLVLTYYIVLRRNRSSHLHRRRRQTRTLTPNPDTDHHFDDDNAHHVWNIRTVGLDDAAINSIPFFAFDGSDGAADGSNCSVCLSEFEKGELVRLLPKCCHAFHAPCIDTWLLSHVNCPLCRVPVVDSGVVGTEESISAIGIHGNVPADGVVISNHIEMPQREGEVGECGIWVNRGGILFGGDNLDAGGSSSSILKHGFRAKSDLGRTGGSQLEDTDHNVCNIRRSISMSYPVVEGLFSVPVEVEENLKQQQGDWVKQEDSKQKDAVDTPSMVNGSGGNSSSSFLSLFKGRSSSVMPLTDI